MVPRHHLLGVAATLVGECREKIRHHHFRLHEMQPSSVTRRWGREGLEEVSVVGQERCSPRVAL